MVVVPPPSPFVPNPSKWSEEREQKGKPHRFLAEGLIIRKSEPVMGEREDFEWDLWLELTVDKVQQIGSD